MKVSEKFYSITNKNSLYNIQAICNMPSIIKRWLLSNEEAIMYEHESIALNEV